MKMKNLYSMILGLTLILVLSACSGGSNSTSTTSTPKQGVTFSFSKNNLISAKTTSKTVASETLDPTAKYASITVTDSNGNTVLSNYKSDIYSLNGSYITATIPLPPGSYQLTQFFVLDSNNNVLYLAPTQSASADIKALVSTLLPINFGATKDQANTVSLQILAVDTATATDYGYPSVIFDLVSYDSFMVSVQTLDSTIENWLLIGAELKLNNVDYTLPAQQTTTLRVAKAGSYTLVFSKTGYNTKTITLTAAEIAQYKTYPLVVVLTPAPFHTVSFNSNGGSAVSSQSIAAGSTATRPVNPSKSGYSFVDWYSDAALSTPFNFSTTITGDITLYAKWTSSALWSYVFDLKWVENLNNPSAVAVDQSGNVYVTDYATSSVKKFSQFGTFIGSWGGVRGSGNGEFSMPWGIAVDQSGNVYVVDKDNHRVQKFDSTGTFITKWGGSGTGDGQFYLPYGIAVDQSGNVYVTEFGNSRVQKFSSTGTFITKWGSLGSGNGQFDEPTGIAVDQSGNVYVADNRNARVQKFSTDGAFITKFGSEGPNNGQLYIPIGIAVDLSGDVFVLESGNKRIQKFSPTGAFITKWGTFGSGDGQFYGPTGIAVDQSGNIYTTDAAVPRVQKFSKQ